MSEKFVNGLASEGNWKYTENGADALKSTTSRLLDLFATIGALRTRSDDEIENMFSQAFYEDKLLATKMSFYARNIRGGLGERRVARTIWKWMANLYPKIVQKNLHLIPEFGRFDDLYAFIGTELENDALDLLHAQFVKDMSSLGEGGQVSLLGKWLKSINTSSKESVSLGRLTARHFGLSEKEYRKSLSALRKQIDVVERRMSSNDWKNIDYEKIPSNAMTQYRKAFKTHDESGFEEYLDKVEKGEAVIHSGTLYPYNIVEKIIYGEYNKVLEEQWKNLPNYIDGENNVLVMADVSGSMHGRPMATSVGLAIYFAERNHGVFKDVFMTFSRNPEFVKLQGNTLYEKINNAESANWDMNTDIQKAMEMILNTAINNNLGQEDLPKSLIIISDMEFDSCSKQNRDTLYGHMKALFASSGYELPRIVFWNVDARQNTFHAEQGDGVQFASGQATSVFRSILDNVNLSAYDLMLEVLNNEAYNEITI